MLVEFNLYGKNIIFDEDLKEYLNTHKPQVNEN